MYKKIALFFLVLTLLFSAGCSHKKSPAEETDDSNDEIVVIDENKEKIVDDIVEDTTVDIPPVIEDNSVTLTASEKKWVDAALKKLAYATADPLARFKNKIDFSKMNEQEKLNFVCAYYIPDKKIWSENIFYEHEKFDEEDQVNILGDGGFIAELASINGKFKTIYGKKLDTSKLYSNYDDDAKEAIANGEIPSGYVSCSAPTPHDELKYEFVKLEFDKQSKIYTMTINQYNKKKLINTYAFKYNSNGKDATFKDCKFISFFVTK